MNRPARPAWLLILALALVAMNLRGAIVSVGSVLPDLRADIGMDAATAGLLTSVPLLTFAALSASAGDLARRFGIDRSLLVATLALAILTLIRPFTPVPVVLLTTIGIGVSITFGNVLLPVVVRRDFAAHQGPMTALTVGSMVSGAALSAALSAPIAAATGWRWALAVWGLTTLVAALAYGAAVRGQSEPVPEQPATRGWAWRRPGAWAMAAYFAFQSGSYYGATAWLPTILPAVTALSAQSAATAASTFQIPGIVGALSVPILVTRFRARRAVAVIVSTTWLALGLGLLLAPSLYLVWFVIAGFGQGGCFALVMTMLTVRAPDAGAVRNLSGMVQTVGYGVAAIIPVAMGWLLDGAGAQAAIVLLTLLGTAVVALAAVIGSRKPV